MPEDKKTEREKLLDQANTAQDFTIEEVLEFTDNNLKWLADELENNEGKAEVDLGFAFEYKQLRDKLKELKEQLEK